MRTTRPIARRFREILGIGKDAIPRQPSLAYDQIVQGIADGKIKGLWVIATNSSHSWIHQGEFNRILNNLDFLVVQDMYPTTETAQRADLVSACGRVGREGRYVDQLRTPHRTG